MNIYSFQLNNLNIVVNEQSHDQATEDKLIELEEKKSMCFIYYLSSSGKNILKSLILNPTLSRNGVVCK